MKVKTQQDIEDLLSNKSMAVFSFDGKNNDVINVTVKKVTKWKCTLSLKGKVLAVGESDTKAELKEGLYKTMGKFGFKESLGGSNIDLGAKELSLGLENVFQGELVFENNKPVITKKKYLFFGPRIFEGVSLKKGEELEKTDYGYNTIDHDNILDNDGSKRAFMKDMETTLFGGNYFERIEKTDYGYNIIDNIGFKRAFGKDMKTKLFGETSFKRIGKTNYGYNTIDKDGIDNSGFKRAFMKDMKTTLFGGIYFKKIEKTDYGYKFSDHRALNMAFEKDMQTKLLGGIYFKKIEKTDYGYEIIDNDDFKRAFEKDMKTKLFGGGCFKKVLYNGKKIYKSIEGNGRIWDAKTLLEIIT